jgi:hypothetical protein
MANSANSGDSSARVQIVVALIGLVGVIATALVANWNNIFPKQKALVPKSAIAASTTAKSAPETTKSTAHKVHSRGRIVIKGTFTCDLDAGSEGGSLPDFQWEQVNRTARYLRPLNGAVFFLVGNVPWGNVTYSALERYPYSAANIDGSDNSNRLSPGSVVAYRTAKGRLGKFIVDDTGSDLTIRWETLD